MNKRCTPRSAALLRAVGLVSLGCVGLTGVALAAGWSSFDAAFPGLPCSDGWAACVVDGTVVSPGMVLDKGQRPHPGDMRMGFFDLDPLPGLSPFAGLTAYTGEAVVADAGTTKTGPKSGGSGSGGGTGGSKSQGSSGGGTGGSSTAASTGGSTGGGTGGGVAAVDPNQGGSQGSGTGGSGTGGSGTGGSGTGGSGTGGSGTGGSGVIPGSTSLAGNSGGTTASGSTAGGTTASGSTAGGTATGGTTTSGGTGGSQTASSGTTGGTGTGGTTGSTASLAGTSTSGTDASTGRTAAGTSTGGTTASGSTGGSTDAVADVSAPKELKVPTPAPAAVPEGCDDLVSLEAPAMMGQLGVGRRKCIEGKLDAVSQTTKNKMSRVLIIDAEARGDRADWERLMKRHLEEIDRSDPDLCFKYAAHLSRGGAGRAHGVIRWADYALENKQQWSGNTYKKRVFALYKLRAQAANSLWQNSETKYVEDRSDANEGKVTKYRGMTKDYSREWLDYARAAGLDQKTPLSLCVSASGSTEFCSG